MAEEFIEQGREEGRNEEARKLMRLVLQGRFTTLDADLVAAIERADAATLEQVLPHATTEALEQLRAPRTELRGALIHVICTPPRRRPLGGARRVRSLRPGGGG